MPPPPPSQEIRRLKEAAESSAARAAHSSDSDSSQHTVIAWLKDMVTMLKGQVADLAEGFNVTQLLQLQQVSRPQIGLGWWKLQMKPLRHHVFLLL